MTENIDIHAVTNLLSIWAGAAKGVVTMDALITARCGERPAIDQDADDETFDAQNRSLSEWERARDSVEAECGAPVGPWYDTLRYVEGEIVALGHDLRELVVGYVGEATVARVERIRGRRVSQRGELILMPAPNRYTALLEAVRRLEKAERDSLAAAERRASLPPGSSRARVTTVNADWARKAEARDRCIESVEAAAVAALPGLAGMDRTRGA